MTMMSNALAYPVTSSRRRPGPTANIRGGAVLGKSVRAAVESSLRLVVGGGLRRHDDVERAGAISTIAITTDKVLSAIGAGAE